MPALKVDESHRLGGLWQGLVRFERIGSHLGLALREPNGKATVLWREPGLFPEVWEIPSPDARLAANSCFYCPHLNRVVMRPQ